MKKIALVLIVLMMAMMVIGCDDTRHYYGIANSEQKIPDVEYQVSAKNVIIGVLLFELALAPTIYIAGWALYESVEPVFLDEYKI